ncbi:MAG: hypothetical protein P8M12_01465 [Flavobacteriales bacterium]|jgi:polyhydroxyalkanoate synthesis regulator phasin|nr:hypothetical protein [Flavobacteriales bacterium]
MDLIKTLAYAGLGLAKQTNDKMKTQFDEFVEVGKKSDIEGKNLVGDFFKTVDTTREEFESQISKNKNKIEERFPFIKDFEDRINELSKIKKEEENEVSSKENEVVDTTIISEEEAK